MKTIYLFFAVAFVSTANVFSQQKFISDSLRKHVFILADDNLEGRSIGAKGGFDAADYIADQFKAVGINPLLDTYFHHFVHRSSSAISSEGKNVIGVIEGSHPELKNEFIVVGGHYDHVGYYYNKHSKEKIIFNGADDNASGVASVIELGRAIAEHKLEFDRSIVFVAFDGEESGLNGSKWMMYDSIIQPSQIKLMLSLDMIGMLSKADGLELTGVGTLENGELMAQQIASKQNIKIKKATNEIESRTDTKPFGDLGIPSIHFTTGAVSPYHKPEDDANLLDYEGMTQITEFTYEFLQKLASAETDKLVSELINKKGELKKKVFIPGLRLNVGSGWHNYVDDFYKGKSAFAVQAGLYAHVELSHRFVLQPEVVYETSGSDNINGRIRTHAITTPVNLLVGFAGNRDYEIWSYFLLGAYYTYNFSGKMGSVDMDYNNMFDPVEYGLNFGYVINVSNVQIGITRKLAITNFLFDKADGNIQNNAFYATIGLQF